MLKGNKMLTIHYGTGQADEVLKCKMGTYNWHLHMNSSFGWWLLNHYVNTFLKWSNYFLSLHTYCLCVKYIMITFMVGIGTCTYDITIIIFLSLALVFPASDSFTCLIQPYKVNYNTYRLTIRLIGRNHIKYIGQLY